MTSDEVGRVAGLSFRLMDRLDRDCGVHPSVRLAAGSGTARVWSVGDAQHIMLIAVLFRGGKILRDAVKAARTPAGYRMTGVGWPGVTRG